LDVFINPLGVPVAVNELDLETYLLSVVPKELGPEKYPEIEALKAQAVAARTFAIERLGSNASRGFDLFEDVRSQVYQGVGTEHPVSDTAVLATRGQIATYQGKPISCMYSSTCGGMTEDFHQLFSGPPVKYLTGGVTCPDEKSPHYHWKETVDIEIIHRNIARIKSVGRIKKIAAVEYSSHGRLIRVRFLGDKEDITLTGNDVRFTLGVKSNYITNLEIKKDKQGFVTSIELEGHGWGHGVGLCQTGAVELASRSWGYEKILKYYYSGIQLVNVY
jgi:stage II sporulation protein D